MNEPQVELREVAIAPLTESDVGTTRPCGCKVTRVSIPCGYLGNEDEDGNSLGHDYPDTGCEACRFGVPAVLHDCLTYE